MTMRRKREIQESKSDKMKKLHFVLVHGAGHGAWIWYKLATLLEKSGHHVTMLDMAASGKNDLPLSEVTTFADYSKPLLDFMEDVCLPEKVVLVGHGFGGINLALAMDMYPDKVAVGIFVNAFMPDTYNSPSYVMEKYMGHFRSSFFKDTIFDRDNGDDRPPTSVKFGPEFLKTKFYQLTRPEDFDLGKMLQRPTKSLEEDLEEQMAYSVDGYGTTSRVVIYGKDDLAIPEWFQHWQIKNCPVKEVKVLKHTDHMSMLSNTKGLYDALLEFASKHH